MREHACVHVYHGQERYAPESSCRRRHLDGADEQFLPSMLTPTLACGSQQAEQGTAPPLRTAGGCVL